MFSDDKKLASYYTQNTDFQSLIKDMLSENYTVLFNVYYSKNVCCRACTLKMLCHYTVTDKFWSLYKIFSTGIYTFHRYDTSYPFAFYIENSHNLDRQGYNKVRNIIYDQEIFWIFYDHIELLLEYSKYLNADEIFELFSRKITQKSILVLKADMQKLVGRFEEIIGFMKNRDEEEHREFSFLVHCYAMSPVRCKRDMKFIMDYCIENMEVPEVSNVFDVIINEDK